MIEAYKVRVVRPWTPSIPAGRVIEVSATYRRRLLQLGMAEDAQDEREAPPQGPPPVTANKPRGKKGKKGKKGKR